MIVLNEVKGQLTYRKIQKSSRYSQNYYRTCGAPRGQVATAAPSALVFTIARSSRVNLKFIMRAGIKASLQKKKPLPR